VLGKLQQSNLAAEGVAIHIGPESCAVAREGFGEALSIPGTAITPEVHTEGGWETASAGGCGTRGQNRPESDRCCAKRYLRLMNSRRRMCPPWTTPLCSNQSLALCQRPAREKWRTANLGR
jgi:hypothetical protein